MSYINYILPILVSAKGKWITELHVIGMVLLHRYNSLNTESPNLLTTVALDTPGTYFCFM